MLGAVVVDVVDFKEVWIRFTATSADVATIGGENLRLPLCVKASLTSHVLGKAFGTSPSVVDHGFLPQVTQMPCSKRLIRRRSNTHAVLPDMLRIATLLAQLEAHHNSNKGPSTSGVDGSPFASPAFCVRSACIRIAPVLVLRRNPRRGQAVAFSQPLFAWCNQFRGGGGGAGLRRTTAQP